MSVCLVCQINCVGGLLMVMFLNYQSELYSKAGTDLVLYIYALEQLYHEEKETFT